MWLGGVCWDGGVPPSTCVWKAEVNVSGLSQLFFPFLPEDPLTWFQLVSFGTLPAPSLCCSAAYRESLPFPPRFCTGFEAPNLGPDPSISFTN